MMTMVEKIYRAGYIIFGLLYAVLSADREFSIIGPFVWRCMACFFFSFLMPGNWPTRYCEKVTKKKVYFIIYIRWF